MGLLVIHDQVESNIGAIVESLRKDAKGLVYEFLDEMSDSQDVLLEDVNYLLELTRFVNHGQFTQEKSEVITSFKEAIDGNKLCWIEGVLYYKAEGDEITEPTESGEDELIFTINPCFKLGRTVYEDAGIGELEEKDYNKITRDEKGIVSGTRIWTGGKMPTVEQRKEAKWGGPKEYTNM